MTGDSTRQPEILKLQRKIDHDFQQPGLLRRALTHSSVAYEQAGRDATEAAAHNEQLEFLGDAVIGLIVTDALYHRYPALREGDLTRLRAALVSRKHLGQVAIKLHLGAALFLGKGEERSGGRKKAALLANATEALAGALYLDAGFQTARGFVERWVVEPYVEELQSAAARGASLGDHKSALQELLQSRKAGQPRYTIKAESGPDHRKRFVVEVGVSRGTESSDSEKRKVLARGSGSTKKLAEQEAARRAFQKLMKEELFREQVGTKVSAGPDLTTAPEVLAP